MIGGSVAQQASMTLRLCSLMEAYAVNRAVNSVKNDTEECIEPVAD